MADSVLRRRRSFGECLVEPVWNKNRIISKATDPSGSIDNFAFNNTAERPEKNAVASNGEHAAEVCAPILFVRVDSRHFDQQFGYVLPIVSGAGISC